VIFNTDFSVPPASPLTPLLGRVVLSAPEQGFAHNAGRMLSQLRSSTPVSSQSTPQQPEEEPTNLTKESQEEELISLGSVPPAPPLRLVPQEPIGKPQKLSSLGSVSPEPPLHVVPTEPIGKPQKLKEESQKEKMKQKTWTAFNIFLTELNRLGRQKQADSKSFYRPQVEAGYIEIRKILQNSILR
jgi:hypothetical protein